jgi:hypothetical protein
MSDASTVPEATHAPCGAHEAIRLRTHPGSFSSSEQPPAIPMTAASAIFNPTSRFGMPGHPSAAPDGEKTSGAADPRRRDPAKNEKRASRNARTHAW